MKRTILIQASPVQTQRIGAMALEAKLGMFVITILVFAFGFIVYRKFDMHQQLASASISPRTGNAAGLPAEGESLTNGVTQPLFPPAVDMTQSSAAFTELADPGNRGDSFASATGAVADPFGSLDTEPVEPAAFPTDVTDYAGAPPTAADEGTLLFPQLDAFGNPPETTVLASTPQEPEPLPSFGTLPDEPVTQPTEPNSEAGDAILDLDGNLFAAADSQTAGTTGNSGDDTHSETSPVFASENPFSDMAAFDEPTNSAPQSFAALDPALKTSNFNGEAVGSAPQARTPGLQDEQPDHQSPPVGRLAAVETALPPVQQDDPWQAVARTPAASAAKIPDPNAEPAYADSAPIRLPFADTEDPSEPVLLAMNDPRPVPQSVDEPPAWPGFGDTPPANANATASSGTSTTAAVDSQDVSPLTLPQDMTELPATRPAPVTQPIGTASQSDPWGQSTASPPAPRKPVQPGSQFSVAAFHYQNDVRQASATEETWDMTVVGKGENYWTISKRVYGTSRYFSALALFNQHRIPDPKKMRDGMKILVPPGQKLEELYPQLFEGQTPRPVQPAAFLVLDDGSPAYRVGASETLSEISQRFLGRSSRWIEIYRLNQRILKDPNILKPGTVLSLPDDAVEVRITP